MLAEDELNGVPLLVFSNKQDVEGALKPEEISDQLGLAGGEKTRQWSVRGSCATQGLGLEEGLDWCVGPPFVFSNPLLTKRQVGQRNTEKIDLLLLFRCHQRQFTSHISFDQYQHNHL